MSSVVELLGTVKVQATRFYSGLLRVTTGTRFVQLVVCGYPRGGTSLLYNMLSASLEGFRFEDFEIPAEYRLHRLGNIASKFPLDILNADRWPSLNVHHKRILVIGVVRDPRDVMTSRHPVVPDRYFIGHDHSWWPQNEDFSEWKFDAPGIIPVHRALQQMEQEEALSFLRVRYEDLVTDPEATQNLLAERFGLEFDHSFRDFHERRDRLAYRYQGRTAARDPSLVRENKAPDPTRAGKWRAPEHRARIIEQFTACPELFSVLRNDGYEPDDSWFEVYAAREAR